MPENVEIGIRLKAELGDAQKIADSFQKIKEKASDFGLDVENIDRLSSINEELGKRFEDVRRKLREFNDELRNTKRFADEAAESGGRFGKMFGIVGGIGAGAIGGYALRQGFAIPQAVGGQYGPLGSGLVGLASSAAQMGLGGIIGAGGLGSGNIPLALAGGSMFLGGLMNAGESVTGTIAGLIQQAYGGVGIYQNLEVQRQAARQMFKNGNINFAGLGNLGVMQEQDIALRGQLGGAINNFSEQFLKSLTGYARVSGIAPEESVAFAGISRYLNTEFGDEFLNRFDKLAEKLGMDAGRRVELQSSMAQLIESFYLQSGRANESAGFGALGIARGIFGNTELGRGGTLTIDFLNRLQSGIQQPSSEAAKLFMLKSAGFGEGRGLWDSLRMMQEGLSNPEMFGNVKERFLRRFGGGTNETQLFALQSLFPGLQKWEIEKVHQAFRTGASFTDLQTGIESEAKARGEKSFFERGAAATTGIQQWWASRQQILNEMGKRLNDSSIRMEKITIDLSDKIGTRIADAIDELSGGSRDLGMVFGTLKGVVSDVATEMKTLITGEDSSTDLSSSSPVRKAVLEAFGALDPNKERERAFGRYIGIDLGPLGTVHPWGKPFFGKTHEEIAKNVASLEKLMPKMTTADLLQFKFPGITPGLDEERYVYEALYMNEVKRRTANLSPSQSHAPISVKVDVYNTGDRAIDAQSLKRSIELNMPNFMKEQVDKSQNTNPAK